jgi:EAL domain-containing protein (putative c-di-GMP-specific phosphodiesterase class I)
MIVDVEPDVLKIDRYFVRGIYADEVRQAVVDTLVRFGRRIGAKVVAEGVGDERELRTVTALGVDLLQGFVFARPAPAQDLAKHPLVLSSTSTKEQS